MTVRIEIFGETAHEALQELTAFSSGLSMPPAAPVQSETATDAPAPAPFIEPAEAAAEPEAPAAAEAPKRERGKPSPGRARRTKEEIAEDEAADKADVEAAAEAKPNITAEPENRVDPAEAEADAQDEAADEANAPAAEATRDDVRAAMIAYQGAYGTASLMADMTAILNEEYPAGNVTKLSEIPDTPEDFARIKGRLDTALADNTFKRERG